MYQIGKSANDNWRLIDEANPEHFWFHLSSFPSSHVILECDNPTNDMFYQAALSCKQATKYKNVPNIKVSYCRVSNLIKGDKIGSVHYKSRRQVEEIKI